VKLVRPGERHLASYVDALERGYAPDNVRGRAEADEQREAIRRDSAAFLAGLDDRKAAGAPIALPDGSTVPRLPGFHRWMWDGTFCGSIALRWQPRTEALPPHCLGHIGYSVVPWKQRRGHATRALALMLVRARVTGLRYVDITTDPDNLASRRTIEANGGVLHEMFVKPAAFGNGPGCRYRIRLG